MISEQSVQLLQLHTQLPANCCLSESLRRCMFDLVYSMLVDFGFCAAGSCRFRLCAFSKFSSTDSSPNRLEVLRTVFFSAVTTARYVIAQNSATLIYFAAEAWKRAGYGFCFALGKFPFRISFMECVTHWPRTFWLPGCYPKI